MKQFPMVWTLFVTIILGRFNFFARDTFYVIADDMSYLCLPVWFYSDSTFTSTNSGACNQQNLSRSINSLEKLLDAKVGCGAT